MGVPNAVGGRSSPPQDSHSTAKADENRASHAGQRERISPWHCGHAFGSSPSDSSKYRCAKPQFRQKATQSPSVLRRSSRSQSEALPIERCSVAAVPALIAFFALAWLANALSLAATDWIFGSVDIDGVWPLVIGGAVLGIANSIVKPILTLLTLPLVILTLGLALFAINVAMLALAEWVAPDFSIDGFWTYIGATIVVWLVNYILYGLFGLRKDAEPAR